MKKEKISLALHILLALTCATFSVVTSDVFLSGTYAICTVGFGVISGMDLHELLTKDK